MSNKSIDSVEPGNGISLTRHEVSNILSAATRSANTESDLLVAVFRFR